MEKIIGMMNSYYLIAISLFLLWFISYIIFNVGGVIHFVFLAGVFVLILKFIKDYSNE